MGHQVQEAGIALQVLAQVRLFINNFLQVINTGSIIAAAKIQHCYFIIKYQHPVAINKKMIVGQFFFNTRHERKTLLKSTQHKMLVHSCSSNINKCLYAETIMFFYSICLGEFFKLAKRWFKLPVIS